MALIKFGGGVAGISGKIGGTVFARNKAGAYARNWAKPVNPVTPAQSLVRGIFGTGSHQWGILTSAERDEWNAQAALQQRINRFGEVYTPSGRQYFLETYNALTQAGLPAITTPVVAATPPAAPTAPALAAAQTAGALTTLSLSWDTVPVGLGDQFVVDAAPIQPDTRTNVNTQYRQIAVIDASAPPNTLLAAFTALFGTTAATGDVARLRVTAVNDTTGLRSAAVLVLAKVT